MNLQQMLGDCTWLIISGPETTGRILSKIYEPQLLKDTNRQKEIERERDRRKRKRKRRGGGGGKESDDFVCV